LHPWAPLTLLVFPLVEFQHQSYSNLFSQQLAGIQVLFIFLTEPSNQDQRRMDGKEFPLRQFFVQVSDFYPSQEVC